MKRTFFLSSIAIVFGSTAWTGCNSVAGKKQAAEPEKETIFFFDDFSGPGLDELKWNTVVTGFHVNRELQAYVDSANVMSFGAGNGPGETTIGALVISPVFSPGFETHDGQQFDFLSGRIDTKGKVEFMYGKAAARIRMSAGAGLWPAWWLLGAGAWPESGEIDIMENVGERDWASAAVHGTGYSGDAALVNRLYFPDSLDVTHWHTYAVDWSRDSLVFLVDDQPMFRVTRPMTTFFGNWAFDSPKYLVLNVAVGGVYPFKTNGVTSPYYGLPDTTWDKIKKGDAAMWVDWVKVTRRS